MAKTSVGVGERLRYNPIILYRNGRGKWGRNPIKHS